MSYTSITCPHCNAEHVGARITSGAQLPNEGGETRYFFVAVCRKCGFPSIMVARRTAGRMADGAPLVRHVCRTERDPVPNFIEPVDMIPAPGTVPTPDGLPGNITSVYVEAQDAIQRGAVNSAALGLRLTLERATRALDGDPKLPLAERIAALAKARALPPTLGQWAGEIALVREKPSDADTDPTPAELEDARHFTEMFLTCAFTLPARIDNRRGLAGEAEVEAEEAETAPPGPTAGAGPADKPASGPGTHVLRRGAAGIGAPNSR